MTLTGIVGNGGIWILHGSSMLLQDTTAYGVGCLWCWVPVCTLGYEQGVPQLLVRNSFRLTIINTKQPKLSIHSNCLIGCKHGLVKADTIAPSSGLTSGPNRKSDEWFL
eukprot:5614659-Amphidinium_carterae.2